MQVFLCFPHSYHWISNHYLTTMLYSTMLTALGYLHHCWYTSRKKVLPQRLPLIVILLLNLTSGPNVITICYSTILWIYWNSYWTTLVQVSLGQARSKFKLLKAHWVNLTKAGLQYDRLALTWQRLVLQKVRSVWQPTIIFSSLRTIITITTCTAPLPPSHPADPLGAPWNINLKTITALAHTGTDTYCLFGGQRVEVVAVVMVVRVVIVVVVMRACYCVYGDSFIVCGEVP